MTLQISRIPLVIDTSIVKNHIYNTLISKLSGKNSSTNIFLYTNNQNPYSSNFIRDADCWLSGVNNIGCLASAQLDGNQPWSAKLPTLISPRHVYFSGHYGPCGFGMTYYNLNTGEPYQCGQEPTPVLFTNSNNQTILRYIVKARYIKDGPYGIDNTGGEVVGLLDREIPPGSLPFAKVLPPHFRNYFPAISEENFIYGFTSVWSQSNFSYPEAGVAPSFNNELYKTHTLSLVKLTDTSISIDGFGYSINQSGYSYISGNQTPDALNSWFTIPIKIGDSGRPVFVIIDNELVLIGILLSAGSGWMVSTLLAYNLINQAMQKLGGGYQLTPINLEYVYNKYKT